MIIVTRKGVTQDEIDHIRERVEALGRRTHISKGEHRTIIGCIGDESALRHAPLLSLPGVHAVHEVQQPYKLASADFAASPTEVTWGSTTLGGNEVIVIAGPCSVEGREMLDETAGRVKAAGARGLRGGAFKPRSSPYSFQGLGEEGLQILADVRAATGLQIVTEVMDTRQVELVASYADVLQIGARNMQNFALLTEVGRLRRPILLKRGMSATVKDLLLAAEYVTSEGNTNVILCERGIRTFETATRNTFDLAAIPVLKRETHLPVIADPSHADGLMIKVHPDPSSATSDGDQSLDFGEFDTVMEGLRPFVAAAGRVMAPAAELAEATEPTG